MTLVRVFSGSYEKKWQILHYLQYIVDSEKHWWKGEQISSEELIRGYGISVDPLLAANEIFGLHQAFGSPGTRYIYHVLLDFTAGSVTPWQADVYGWEISGYLRKHGLQYLQGVHCTKGNGIEHPHLHLIVNALYPLTGMKFHMGFDFLRSFKAFTNMVCYKHSIPLIVLGQKSLPFYILNKKDGEF